MERVKSVMQWVFAIPKWIYQKLNGFKTYLALGLGFLVQFTQILPANTLSTALGLNAQQAAALTTVFLVLAFYGRVVAKPIDKPDV